MVNTLGDHGGDAVDTPLPFSNSLPEDIRDYFNNTKYRDEPSHNYDVNDPHVASIISHGRPLGEQKAARRRNYLQSASVRDNVFTAQQRHFAEQLDDYSQSSFDKKERRERGTGGVKRPAKAISEKILSGGRARGKRVKRDTRVFNLQSYDWREHYFKLENPPNDFMWGQKRSGKSTLLELFWLEILPPWAMAYYGSPGGQLTTVGRIPKCFTIPWGIDSENKTNLKKDENLGYLQFQKMMDRQRNMVAEHPFYDTTVETSWDDISTDAKFIHSTDFAELACKARHYNIGQKHLMHNITQVHPVVRDNHDQSFIFAPGKKRQMRALFEMLVDDVFEEGQEGFLDWVDMVRQYTTNKGCLIFDFNERSGKMETTMFAIDPKYRPPRSIHRPSGYIVSPVCVQCCVERCESLKKSRVNQIVTTKLQETDWAKNLKITPDYRQPILPPPPPHYQQQQSTPTMIPPIAYSYPHLHGGLSSVHQYNPYVQYPNNSNYSSYSNYNNIQMSTPLYTPQLPIYSVTGNYLPQPSTYTHAPFTTPAPPPSPPPPPSSMLSSIPPYPQHQHHHNPHSTIPDNRQKERTDDRSHKSSSSSASWVDDGRYKRRNSNDDISNARSSIPTGGSSRSSSISIHHAAAESAKIHGPTYTAAGVPKRWIPPQSEAMKRRVEADIKFPTDYNWNEVTYKDFHDNTIDVSSDDYSRESPVPLWERAGFQKNQPRYINNQPNGVYQTDIRLRG
jgi:hypothetical protein